MQRTAPHKLSLARQALCPRIGHSLRRLARAVRLPNRRCRSNGRATVTVALHILLCVSPSHAAESELRGAGFALVFDQERGSVTSLKCDHDPHSAEFIKPGHLLGDVTLSYRRPGEPWRTARLGDPGAHYIVESDSNGVEVRYRLPGDLELVKTFALSASRLAWILKLRNLGEQTLEVGDLGLPLRMNTDYVGGDLQDEDAVRKTYESRLNRHRLVAGHGSFVYWTKAIGFGPILVMTPSGATRLEYFDAGHTAFVHSARSGPDAPQGTWRQPHTGVTLAPKGEPNDAARYGFTFAWANNLRDVRDILYDDGLLDVYVVPGMTLPTDLTARVALRTRSRTLTLQPEHPEATSIVYLGEAQPDVHVYELGFSRLGENAVRVDYDGGRSLKLEFFSTESLETLYRKRARFITQKQQHRNGKWYNGLFSLWDMREKALRGPEDTGGLQDYMVGGSDDPSNSKAVLVAEKNVVLPDADEIAALEYYLEHFVWGKLQRTNQEHPHPYGIYGSENWYLNRTTAWGTTLPDRIRSYEKMFGVPQGTGLGAERLWRSFDYTTFIMLYYDMYRIADQYPNLVTYLDAQGYLERAYGTAQAYFRVPYAIHLVGRPLWSHKGYSDWAYKLGNFHERYLIDLIRTLRQEGMDQEAEWLRGEWEKKVKYFLYDEPFPFGSEFVFDRTAFESTHAIARYAIENPMQPDRNLWFDRNRNRWYSHPDVRPEHAELFMKRQIDANIAMRGSLEATYYYLGSARVGANTLDYMSQMAGWAVLDYGLHYSDDPAPYVRLGYASLLSSWALVNSGTAESGYGYWYPGEENDGAAGWCFQTLKNGENWATGTSARGIWPYDGEIDHGLASGIRAAATVVMDDPLFGRIAIGGSYGSRDGWNTVVPQDGVRRRLHLLVGSERVHLTLHTDGLQKSEEVLFNDDLTYLKFQLENRSGVAHQGSFEVSGLPDGEYAFVLNGQHIRSFDSDRGQKIHHSFDVSGVRRHTALVQRQ
ncbi:hypothetical protein Pla111_26290 [Botrimarina hoheduenensis]|uniref:Uncharacterized protein n=1 Tax=Botrimarina hoheduenensis TaxID=2528000 RepID=A0A5C5VX14_9BACT|nr:hypothetical protein Pla111_26290 [Botrimarina hoheduenensis]